MQNLTINGLDVSQDLIRFTQELVRTKSYSGEEEQVCRLIAAKMTALGYDEVKIDRCGSVLGRVGSGAKVILFDSHIDTVKVPDENLWQVNPFSGDIIDGYLWGRGSVDMKSGAASSVYAAAVAKSLGLLEGKSVYVSCTPFEEDCDGECLKMLLEQYQIKPDFAIICEPSGNKITLGHKGKAQMKIKTHGVSAHGSAPEKGINAIYEMAEIIQRVEQINLNLMKNSPESGKRGTLVLSRISSVAASLNAVPSECEIYMDRRLAVGENEQTIRDEMSYAIGTKDAGWEFDLFHVTAWTGEKFTYRPFHLAWEIAEDHPLTRACVRAHADAFGKEPDGFDFWDFSTNAVSIIPMGISTIGYGPGEYKLAHMRDERCAVSQIIDACAFYSQVIKEL